MVTRTIKLMTDYGCFPLWDCSHPENINPAQLPLSSSLVADLSAWAERYDSTLDMADPQSAGFKSEEDLVKFEEEGRRLWLRLKSELGEQYLVKYFSSIENKLLD